MAGSWEREWSPALETAHLDLSPLDRDFRKLALASPALLDRSTFHVLDEHKDLFAFRMQPWPTFVERSRMEEFKRLSLGVSALLKRVPERFFRGKDAELARFYDLPSPAVGAVLLEEPNCIADAISRGDFINTAEGFKCIEFNFSPNLGGWETSIMVDLLQSIAPTGEFMRRVSFTYANTLRALHRHIIGDCLRRGLCRDELNIALILRPEDMHDRLARGEALLNQELARALEELASGLRGRLKICTPADFSCHQGQAFLDGARVHAVVDYTDQAVDVRLYRCFKAESLSLFNGPVERLLSDKRNLALLSEFAGSRLFDQAERELIHRSIPWTRRIAPRLVDYQGRRRPLPELLIAEQDDFVIKQGRSFGGKAVFFGRSTPEAEWRQRIGAALKDGRWVAQKRLESLPYLFQCGPSGCAAHDVIWGPFVFGETYGGVILRMQPKADAAPVNLSLSATGGIVLEV